MKRLDYKHIAFHVLGAVYWIWVAVFLVLISMALGNEYGAGNSMLSQPFISWILLNLITGTALFLVLRQFKGPRLYSRLILHSYLFTAAAAVIAAAIIGIKN